MTKKDNLELKPMSMGGSAKEPMKKNWYVLRAVSGKEAKVKEYLDLEIKNNRFGDCVAQVMIPVEKVVQIRNGKRVVKERTSLPGYVFVEATLVGEIAHDLRNTPDVLGFLGGMDNPTPLRQSEVNRMLGAVEEMQENENFDIPFAVGETVKVTEGPFSGFDGTIEEVNGEKRKLKVMVKIFGRPSPLEVGFTQVTKE
jgi:transcriptional antiterminator NusG